jgi:hypothetical protein
VIAHHILRTVSKNALGSRVPGEDVSGWIQEQNGVFFEVVDQKGVTGFAFLKGGFYTVPDHPSAPKVRNTIPTTQRKRTRDAESNRRVCPGAGVALCRATKTKRTFARIDKTARPVIHRLE